MNARPLILACALLAGLGVPVLGSAASVEIFTLASLPAIAAPTGAIVYELDAQARLEEQLSRDLPGEPEAAARIAEARINAGGPVLQRDLIRAGKGLARAIALGIDRVPAIVVDGRWVAYGETDVAKALSLAAPYRNRAQGSTR